MTDIPTTPAWDAYLAGLDPDRRAIALDWAAGRPPEIRAMLYRFPPGSTAMIKGRTAWLVSYTESREGHGPGFFFSYINPASDYDAALASRFYVCGEHVDDKDPAR